ncbi:MAG: hypothetical protein ACJAZ3_000990 [Sphingobacteriales bacterium]|jgi:hypothetical protein
MKDKKPEKISPLKVLEEDLAFYNESLIEISRDILNEGLSEFPIFVAHQHEVELGEPILKHEELGTSWTIHASMLEEFVKKGVIKKEREDNFKKTFKDPLKYCCLFVIVPEGANFVFSPYKEQND